MIMVFPGVVNVAGMLQHGLSEIAGWLFNSLDSQQKRTEFLQMRFPDASSGEIKKALSQAESAWQAAEQAEAGFGLPPAGQIPVNPALANTGSYEVDVGVEVKFETHNDEGEKGTEHMWLKRRLRIDPDTPWEDVLDELNDWIDEQLEGEQYDIDWDYVDKTMEPKIYINSVWRG